MPLKDCIIYHQSIVNELFPDKTHTIHNKLSQLFIQLEFQLQGVSKENNYDKSYDQLISYGEIFSSTILHYFLQTQQLLNTWIDSRKYIQTDGNWREGRVDWPNTEQLMLKDLPNILKNQIIVTQGFIGGTSNGLTTTLGREGSDFSAAIFAYCLNADEMYIWKDVDGLLNADPKHFEETVLFDEISYQETVEMAYYGASVIHPKTIKPLANKLIPLYIKSFINPNSQGTKIWDFKSRLYIPAFIMKEQQCLISFSSKDFAFISEKSLGLIFNTLSESRIKINMMQNSAISFSICVDYNPPKIEKLIHSLTNEFSIYYNFNLKLFTIKNYDSKSINHILAGKEVLLEQRSRNTYQIVCK
jgi:aspartate kinase